MQDDFCFLIWIICSLLDQISLLSMLMHPSLIAIKRLKWEILMILSEECLFVCFVFVLNVNSWWFSWKLCKEGKDILNKLSHFFQNIFSILWLWVYYLTLNTIQYETCEHRTQTILGQNKWQEITNFFFFF